ncbi:MAG: UDP-N-acetylmuramate dehydrogenase [Thermodesulfobacteriota bacterium]
MKEFEWLENLTVNKDFPMKNYTSIKVGGNAKILVYPRSLDELTAVLENLSKSNLKFSVLGAGSNTIVSDEGINKVVISTKKLKKVNFNDDGIVEAECGVMLSSIMNNAVKKGLIGFEFAAGIPGTVGGSVYMNAGANGGEIKDVLSRVYGWHNGREVIIERNKICFDYRKSNLPKSFVVTKAVFQLRKGSGKKSSENIKSYLEYRNSTQPVKIANTGSIFKNPSNISAGKLLEELGFKGYTIGGAKFSELHANFIVNFNNASAKDIISLINKAKTKASLERGIKLETEVKIIGENGK